MIKGFRQLVSFTLLSRVLGLARDMAFSFYFGAGMLMDSWVIAFMIPNLARRLFGEGAAATSFIPVYTEQLHRDKTAALKLARTVVTFVAAILIGLVILGELGIWTSYAAIADLESTKLKLELTGIMLPFMLLICIVALFAGILNSHGHFAAPAAAPCILNVFIISGMFFGAKLFPSGPARFIYFVAAMVVAAGLAQNTLQLLALKRHNITIRPAWDIHSPAFKKVMTMMLPMVLGLTATQINTLADGLIAMWFSGSAEKGSSFLLFGNELNYPMWEGSVSSLFYSQRLYQFPLGVLGISLATAAYPVMSKAAAAKDHKQLTNIIAHSIRAALFIAVPATLGLILIRSQLVSVIFEQGRFDSEDTIRTAAILLFYSIGLTGFFLQQVITRAFYSMQDSKLPARTAAIAVLFNVTLNLILIWPLGAAGLALSTAVCSYLQVFVLLFALRGKFGTNVFEKVHITILKVFAASAIMFAIGLLVLRVLSNWSQTSIYETIINLAPSWLDAKIENIGCIIAAVFVCSISYAILSKLFKIHSMSIITKRKLDLEK